MTELIYLQHPDMYETDATIQGMGTDARGWYFVLDRSVFYPQGGGQPADRGQIIYGDIFYKVCDVRNAEGEIRHYVDPDHQNDNALSGEIKMVVDEGQRTVHAKLHTAGHLIAAVAQELSSEIVAVKGHHFPGEAYVEFDGMVLDPDDFVKELTLAMGTYLDSNRAVKTEDMDSKQAEIMAQSLPYSLPKNKSLRVCRIEGFDPVPCGGTHVATLKDIGHVVIKKCKSKKGKTKIFYEVVS